MKEESRDNGTIIILGISALALLFLLWLIYLKPPATSQFINIHWLPNLNATFNLLSAFFLLRGIYLIRRGHKEQHKTSMLIAFVFSTLFLISYLIYHYFHGDTQFEVGGIIRPIYFFILISHIVLSIPALPMVLLTFYFALTKKWDKHKKLAKWTFPIWLYVSVTGVLVISILRIFN